MNIISEVIDDKIIKISLKEFNEYNFLKREMRKYMLAFEDLKNETHEITKRYNYNAGNEISDKTFKDLENKYKIGDN